MVRIAFFIMGFKLRSYVGNASGKHRSNTEPFFRGPLLIGLINPAKRDCRLALLHLKKPQLKQPPVFRHPIHEWFQGYQP